MASQGSAALGRQPIVPSGVLAMVLFLATEAMFFGGLISAFVVLRAATLDWPPLGQPRLPIGLTGINTVILLLSGYAMHRAVACVRKGEASLIAWLSGTALLGCVFLGIQGYEWLKLIGFGLTTRSSLYGATFYTLVGAHGLHVLAALVVLLVVLARGIQGRYTAAAHGELELCRMYWLFVVAVWPVLYVLVYLR
jgi:heme/copper-type cytochrome/quinol oxidase subunit 3